MYLGLVVGVLIGWVVLVVLTIAGYRRSAFGAFVMLGGVGLWTAAAVACVFVFGPYWQVLYRTVLQPG
jgi:hypothetical protein